jgi:PTH1 family peptidyl-tRNA hydrolase
MATFRLIVGLGNPGREYAETRHNAGFMVLDRLAAGAGARFRMEKKWQAEVAVLGDVWLCKPQTYMNLSGESASAIGHFYKIEPAQVLVVLDDLALPLGRLRLRESGSAGGQKGLASILQHLGTQAIPRLRVGIGAAEGDASSHVLGRFSPEERPVLDGAVARAAEAIEFAQSHGFAAAMNKYNQTSTTQN